MKLHDKIPVYRRNLLLENIVYSAELVILKPNTFSRNKFRVLFAHLNMEQLLIKPLKYTRRRKRPTEVTFQAELLKNSSCRNVHY
jgi:hypothetical protein